MIFRFAIASFFILVLTILNLFLGSIAVSITLEHYVWAFLKIIVFLLMVYEIKREWKFSIKSKKEILYSEKIKTEDYISVIAVIFGTLASFALNNELNMQAVAASSIVGIIPAFVLNKYQIPIYCGSFVGMASAEVFTSYPNVFLAGLITGILLVSAKPVFTGFGGKLGAAAFFGTMSVSLIAGKFPLQSQKLSLTVNYLVVFYFVLGALGTYLLNEKKKIGVVASSGIVGLLAAVILPLIHPENGDLLSVAVFCASFIGMSSIDRMQRKAYMTIAGVFGAIIFVYTSTLYIGLGGKLGAIAFGSTIATAGLIDIKRKYIK